MTVKLENVITKRIYIFCNELGMAVNKLANMAEILAGLLKIKF